MICRSTWSGVSVGADVLICIWTGVVSGNASMSMNKRETAPNSAQSTAAMQGPVEIVPTSELRAKPPTTPIIPTSQA